MNQSSRPDLAQAFADPSFHNGLARLADALPQVNSVAEVLKTAMEFLNVTVDARRHQIIEVASALAESRHEGEYHNTPHFRDVPACGAFLLGHMPHNLREDQIFNFMIFFALHDLFHDGKTNMTPQGYERFRLEDMSFRAARAALEPFGMSVDEMEDMHALFRATDVSKAGPRDLSAAEKVRTMDAALVSHAFNDAYFLGVESPIERFVGRPDLHLMAQIAQVADLMPSGALTLAYTLQNSQRLEWENGTPATAASFNWFADNLARGAFERLPHVGRELVARLNYIRKGVNMLPHPSLAPAA